MEDIKYLTKIEMEDGQWYQGICRNAQIAMWDKNLDKFRHLRNKFGQWFMEEIEHFDDVKEVRLDGFIPVKKVIKIDGGELARIRREVGY